MGGASHARGRRFETRRAHGKKSLQVCIFLGGLVSARETERAFTRVITRKTPAVRGGPQAPVTTSWRLWSPASTTSTRCSTRPTRPICAQPSCSLPRRQPSCSGSRASSSTRTRRRSVAGACWATVGHGASLGASCSRAAQTRRRHRPARPAALAQRPAARWPARRCLPPSPAARALSAPRAGGLRG
jgi:hypothetical protein